MVSQLTLGLRLRDDATFTNFYPGDNLALLNHLQAFSAAIGESYIYLWGAPGSGRTHLLHACCHALPAEQSIYLDLAEPGLESAVFMNLEYFPLVCLDNIESVLAGREWELALFNFYNRFKEQGGRLLISGLAPPARLSCQLADLGSRLSSGLILNICPLNDQQKLAALQMRAKQRGLELSPEVGGFLLNHYSRNMNDLFLALDTLDQEALSAKRRLTIPFIKQVVKI